MELLFKLLFNQNDRINRRILNVVWIFLFTLKISKNSDKHFEELKSSNNFSDQRDFLFSFEIER